MSGRLKVAQFVVYGEPRSKARSRTVSRGGRTWTYTPRGTVTAEALIRAAYLEANPGVGPDPEASYSVDATFYNGTRQRRDVDNMLKAVLDGLNGHAWVDDNQVSEVRAAKVYTGDRKTARTEVSIAIVGSHPKNTKACARCGEHFETWPSLVDKQKFCSAACRGQSRREVRTYACAHCGVDFESSHKATYCTKECRNAAGRDEISCSVCGARFTQVRSWIAQGRTQCSKECSAVRAKERRAERRSTHFPGTCLVCGAGTTRKEYRRCNPCKLAGKEVPA